MATHTTREIAEKFDTDPKTLRKFLRSPEGVGEKVGRGQRWAIEGKQIRSLKTRFKKWSEEHSTAA